MHHQAWLLTYYRRRRALNIYKGLRYQHRRALLVLRLDTLQSGKNQSNKCSIRRIAS
jgi:hypothetical protein